MPPRLQSAKHTLHRSSIRITVRTANRESHDVVDLAKRRRQVNPERTKVDQELPRQRTRPFDTILHPKKCKGKATRKILTGIYLVDYLSNVSNDYISIYSRRIDGVDNNLSLPVRQLVEIRCITVQRCEPLRA